MNRDTVGIPWIGVDLDGTLAHYDGWRGYTHIGEPIPKMVERVKKWLAEGKEVRIFTARVRPILPDYECEAYYGVLAIRKWCVEHIGCELPITCVKDAGMLELWDDRCVPVLPNVGNIGIKNVNLYVKELVRRWEEPR